MKGCHSEGMDTIQGDLGRLERWARANLMEFNMVKYKTSYFPQLELYPEYQLKEERKSLALRSIYPLLFCLPLS